MYDWFYDNTAGLLVFLGVVLSFAMLMGAIVYSSRNSAAQQTRRAEIYTEAAKEMAKDLGAVFGRCE